MSAPTSPAEPVDRFDLAVDPGAEPANVDHFLDALDRIIERRMPDRLALKKPPGPAGLFRGVEMCR